MNDHKCPYGHGEMLYIGETAGVDGNKYHLWRCITCGHSEMDPYPSWYGFIAPIFWGQENTRR